MSSEPFFISGTAYILSRDAARTVHFTPDYVSRLARQGIIDAKRLSTQWVVNLASLNRFVSEQERHKKLRRAELARRRREEQRLVGHPSATAT